MTFSIKEKFATLHQMIGNTPLAEIYLRYKGKATKVYAKIEYYNYTGSIKDRIALHMLEKAYEREIIHTGDTICEGTSGNTGIAISAVGAFLGHKVVIYMPDWMTEERRHLIKSLGAEVRLISKEEGGLTAMFGLIKKFASKGNVFLTEQFSNQDNVEAHYQTTGREIYKQLLPLGIIPDGVVAGVGTGGTIVGIATYLKEKNPGLKVFPLEPDNSLLLSKGRANEQHFIYGIGDGFIPEIASKYPMDEVITVNEIDAVLMSQKLSRSLGLGVGISSGANFLGVLKAKELIGLDSNIVTVFADDNKKYLTSEYSEDFPIKDNYISKDVVLEGMKIYRSC